MMDWFCLSIGQTSLKFLSYGGKETTKYKLFAILFRWPFSPLKDIESQPKGHHTFCIELLPIELFLIVASPEDPGPSSVATQLASLVQSELWDLGQMESVVSYLSRNRHLDIPPSFAEALRGELAP